MLLLKTVCKRTAIWSIWCFPIPPPRKAKKKIKKSPKNPNLNPWKSKQGLQTVPMAKGGFLTWKEKKRWGQWGGSKKKKNGVNNQSSELNQCGSFAIKHSHQIPALQWTLQIWAELSPNNSVPARKDLENVHLIEGFKAAALNKANEGYSCKFWSK